MNNPSKILNPKMLLSIFGFIIFLSISLSCMSKDEISKTYLHCSFPLFKSDTIYTILDSVAVIHYKNYALYEFEDIHTVQNDTAIIERKVINRYFLLKEKEKYGYYYDSLNAKNSKKARTDSILGEKAYYNQTFFVPSIMQLISSKKDQDGYILIEKYKCKSKIDHTYPDTTIVFYANKMKGINFTLSKDLDSIKKMKVIKLRAIFNSQFIKGYPKKIPQYEYKFELKQDSISNLKKYKDFIEKEISK
ncbi:hypothetical protein [Flavobacterium anhuiense]|uniref:hypothetical protein n=1 Tax=Flavobacterium anhuiense TaxID=459526 RepID=UPI0020267F27|nr:hypothetical protein [Flavobacterium anhuiense]URM38890.1 hypothetical protein LLY39_10350 [Flavobacterium anhuiense]